MLWYSSSQTSEYNVFQEQFNNKDVFALSLLLVALSKTCLYCHTYCHTYNLKSYFNCLIVIVAVELLCYYMYNERLGPSLKSTSNKIPSRLVESYIRTKLARFFKNEILKMMQYHAGSFTLSYINHLTLLINIKAHKQEKCFKAQNFI